MTTSSKSKRGQQVIDILIHLGVIPNQGGFEITSEIIDKYFSLYKELTKLSKVGLPANKPNRPSDNEFARKIAAIKLLELNLTRGYRPSSGILYAITNPAFPGYYKVGITQDLDKRLASYQTYDPLRRYRVEFYRFVNNVKEEEKRILSSCKTDLAKGEWIVVEQLKNIFPENL